MVVSLYLVPLASCKAEYFSETCCFVKPTKLTTFQVNFRNLLFVISKGLLSLEMKNVVAKLESVRGGSTSM